MYNPDIEQIGNLSQVKKLLVNFKEDFDLSYDKDDELDAQMYTMIDLIIDGFLSVYDVLKTRI